jgi:hypothetical protein
MGRDQGGTRRTMQYRRCIVVTEPASECVWGVGRVPIDSMTVFLLLDDRQPH